MRELDLIYMRHNTGPRNTKIDHQRITYYDLTLVLRGELDYEIDGESVPLTSGDMIFIHPGSVRSRAPSDETNDYISFNFRSEESFSLPLFVKGAVSSEMRMLIETLDRINGEYYFDNKEKNSYILGCLLSMLEDRVKYRDLSPLTLKIMSYINANLQKRITLEEIGGLTFFSPVYCDTVFKRETGRAIIDYQLDRRIDEAKRSLIDKTMSLTQISEAVGFSDYNYFCRVFKKRTGSTPSEYRRTMWIE